MGGRRTTHLLATMLLLAASEAAAAPPNATCVALCTAPAPEPAPQCAACEPTNACSDLLHTDRPAYDTCVAEHEACYQEHYDCLQGGSVGPRARSACAASSDVPACCDRACAPDLVVEPNRSSGRWLFFDLLMAGLVRHVPGDYSGQYSMGLTVETLFGPTEWRGRRVPMRLGPFGSATLNFDSDEDVGFQASAGLTALLYGRRGNMDVLAKPVMLSAGVIIDVPPELSNRVGGLARLSLGMTTTGRRHWKFISGWVFAEGHYIPGGEGEGERIEVLLGLRIAPFIIPFALIPGAQDQ